MIDLLALWNWEHDADFIRLLEAACAQRGLSFLALNEYELEGMVERLERGEWQARAVLDRAWEVTRDETDYERAVARMSPRLLNPYAEVRRVANKPSMHYLLMQHGFHVPYLMVLPSVQEAPTLAKRDISPLGGQFSIKGAHGGGSGVLHPASTWEAIERQRQDWPDDETILQAWVTPRMMGARPAWFRLFYACGDVFACWANDRTHIQTPVSEADAREHGLEALQAWMRKIAGLCGLNAFSTEIVQDEQLVWKVVDYVNEPCDYRLKSAALNGVPDDVVTGITAAMAQWVLNEPAKVDALL